MTVKWHVGLLAAVLAATTVSADEFDRIRAQDQIAAQKLNSEVKSEQALARDLMRTNPAQAVQVLEGTLAKLASSRALPPSTQTRLVSEVRSQLAQAREVARAIGVEKSLLPLAKPDPLVAPVYNPPVGTPSVNTGKKTSGAIDSIVGNAKGQLDKAHQQKIVTAMKTNDVFNSIASSATPIAGVVEYSPAWKIITETRKEKIDPQELAILQALNSVMSVDFNNTAFKDVIDIIQEKAKIAVFINEASRKEAMVEYDDPVTLKVNKATVRTILRKILGDRNLTYIIEEGSIQVMTIQKARERTVARVYSVNDLVTLNIDPRLALIDPLTAQAMKYQNGLFLANMIMQTVDPTYWAPAGGPGTVIFDPITSSLVVRASAEMHHMLGGSGMLRR